MFYCMFYFTCDRSLTQVNHHYRPLPIGDPVPTYIHPIHASLSLSSRFTFPSPPLPFSPDSNRPLKTCQRVWRSAVSSPGLSFLHVCSHKASGCSTYNMCLRHNLNAKLVRIGKLIYTELLGSKLAPLELMALFGRTPLTFLRPASC